ncbi:MAG: hypothetical protein GX803_04750 [Lentisphaerae bacterium]|jgi:hypothetical protein|nr:hypothetical protein [Lentisphaerota bacterium]
MALIFQTGARKAGADGPVAARVSGADVVGRSGGSLVGVRRAWRRWMCWAVVALWGAAAAGDVAVKIGNPLLAKFPAGGNARPRSIWDLQVFDDKLYLAHGDYWSDAGPIDVWTYTGDGTNFVKEYTVQEEMIWDFFVQGDWLFIPGVDTEENGPNLESAYMKRAGATNAWVKKTILHGARHSYDVALFQDRLFASVTLTNKTGRTMVSSNMGDSWSVLTHQYSALIPFDDFLFLQGGTNYVYDGTKLTKVTPDVKFGQLAMARRARAEETLVYAYPARWALGETKLYAITAAEILSGGAAEEIGAFSGTCVRDVLERDGLWYVMTAESVPEQTYCGRIFVSDDLTHWWQATEFTAPEVPLSFELYRNRFYVGLGGVLPDPRDSLVAPEAGSIWRVEPSGVELAAGLDDDPGAVWQVAGPPGLVFTVEATSSLVVPQWEAIGTVQSASGLAGFVDPEADEHPVRYYRVVVR